MKSPKEKIARLLHVHGRVQAVGFRPFVWRIASNIGIAGFVFNQPDGVIIHIEGSKDECDKFELRLKNDAPTAAIIKSIDSKRTDLKGYSEFHIEKSKDGYELITEVCPDIAVCDDCLQELFSRDRRENYPFINCTNCGPRFTLINDFPYDRALTTMAEFEMCPGCMLEYTNPGDRRFHAQPISCPDCGPKYSYRVQGTEIRDTHSILKKLKEVLDAGEVVAIKGLGGYNLVCNAKNDSAVAAIREIKKRDKKPFAVMFRDLDAIKKIAILDSQEEEILQSWRRPILILNKIKQNTLSKHLNYQLRSLGVFLPYLPLHYLLFDKLKTDALVVTSGNESDVPILYSEDAAFATFQSLSGGILMNNRKIARRCDDSVVKIIHAKPQLLRRARAYAPAPVDLNFDVDGILALGAELSNCFCLGKGNQAVMSQHIGDLKNIETHDFFCENIHEFSRMYRFKPQRIVCDLHPDYLSTQYAEQTGLPLIHVQHHHAHIASVMAEHQLEGEVIGLAFDGTGFGTDGNIWGSEVLICDFKEFRRFGHFEYVAMPGGDRVTKQPWRSGLAYLMKAFPDNWKTLDIPFIRELNDEKMEAVEFSIQKKINSPLSCSAGRLFDAVAAILSVCIESNYHAEAPMLLEDMTIANCSASYAFEGTSIISFSSAIKQIVADIEHKFPTNKIVTRFHNTVALAMLHLVKSASRNCDSKRVVLSGGTFQNKYLTEKLVLLLEEEKFDVYLPAEVPANDGGIALGQIAIAAHKI